MKDSFFFIFSTFCLYYKIGSVVSFILTSAPISLALKAAAFEKLDLIGDTQDHY
jgi:hypothetical protein